MMAQLHDAYVHLYEEGNIICQCQCDTCYFMRTPNTHPQGGASTATSCSVSMATAHVQLADPITPRHCRNAVCVD